MHPGLAADSRYKNYLIWLQERGIVWPVFRSPEAATVPGPGTDEEADPRRENPLPDTPPAAKGPDAGTAGPKIAIIRPTDIPAGAAELRRRMEGAMGLGDDAVLHLAPGNGDRSIYRTILSQGCQVVMLMGESAYRDFFPTGRPFDQCRGHPLRHGMLGEMPVLATRDAPELLSQPELKREAWQDMQLVMKLAGLSIHKK